MILLVNVLLTDERINDDILKQQRGFLDWPFRPYSYDKVDIFKYTLASYSVIPFSKVLINCSLNGNYSHRKEELKNFLEKEFAGQNLKLKFDRIEYQKDWQKLYDEELDDDVIWFSCNHDHIFMDYNLDILNDGTKLLSQAIDSPASIYPSHWPELLNKASYIHNEKPGPTDVYDKYVGFHLMNNNDSFQIINKALYRKWWFDEDYGDAYLPRSDYRLADKNGTPIGYDIRQGRKTGMLHHYCFVPLRELCRHYDGYGHVEINPNLCPALSIPPGFFDNNIKIKYGYRDNHTDCVNIKPTEKYYSILDKNGTDYKWIMSDIPLFWRDRISDIDENDTYELDTAYREYIYECRNESVLETAHASMVIHGHQHHESYTWYDKLTKINTKDAHG